MKKVNCEHYNGRGCNLINNKLGFTVGLHEDFCSKCLSNGPTSEASTALREKVVDNVHKTARDNPEVAEKMAAYVGWKEAKVTWNNATAWIKSKASKTFSTISLQVLNQRKESCFGSDATKACNLMRKHTDGYHYCGSCGCGVREEARLDGSPSKLEYPYLECPLKRPGFSNHESVSKPDSV